MLPKWFLYMILTLVDGDVVVAPIHDYGVNEAACVAEKLLVEEVNKNPALTFVCATDEPKGT